MTEKILKNAMVILFGGLSLFSCSKDSPSLLYDIYVAGNNGGPVYWKNGASTMLNGDGGCTGIVVVNKDIYVSGIEFPNNNPNYPNKFEYVYWKNGDQYILPNSYYLTYQTSAIAV